MDIPTYATLTRQMGLFRELDVLANNIANAPTFGFREESLVFSEYLPKQAGDQSVSFAHANLSRTDFTAGPLISTGNSVDLALQGDGFFLVESGSGPKLTRAGNFTVSADHRLVTAKGWPVLDIGQAPLFVPPPLGALSFSKTGDLHSGDHFLGQIGVFTVEDITRLTRHDGVSFAPNQPLLLQKKPDVMQGFLEQSNSDITSQIARLITVQRAYEMGQTFLENEESRIKKSLNMLLK
jgi:flagellar basal-body rod protein FlgF